MIVPSYTSNSNSVNWPKSWLLALLLALVALAALEVFWRMNGHKPAIIDDQRLWAVERSKAGKSEKEIVLLGSSRMQTDISTTTLRRLAPEYNVIDLFADGTCANAVLRNLGEDKNFRGIALCETTAECLLFGDNGDLSQQSYIDFYQNVYNYNIKANREIATLLQNNFTVFDPYLNVIKVFGDLIAKKTLRSPNYVTTYEDRSRAADYGKLDIEKHKAKRLMKVETNYRNIESSISVKAFDEQVASLDHAVKQIQNRGGKVIFIRFPVSDEHWTIDEKYFPRAMYWDTIIQKTSASIIHFKDIYGMNTLQCPDTSHLDVSDTEAFTTQLFNVLHKEKII